MSSNTNVAKQSLGDTVHVRIIPREQPYSDVLVLEMSEEMVDILEWYREDRHTYQFKVASLPDARTMRKRDCLVEMYSKDRY